MIAFLAIGIAAADQTAFDLDRGTPATSFRYAWTDRADRAHTASFELPSAAIAADEASAARPVQREMPAEVAAAIRERVTGRIEGVEFTVTAQDDGVSLGAAGSGDVPAAIALLEQVHEEVLVDWLRAHHHLRVGPDQLGWDLPRLASEYADDVAPVAEALGVGVPSEREFVEKALSFVQSIPYERLRSDGSGYRPPLAVLSTNSGDCDSKGVLFLALVHARAPRVPLAVVNVPGHVLVGVGLPRKKGDTDFSADRVRYLYAEPVGPGLYPLGQLDPDNVGPAALGVVRPVPPAR